MQTRKELRQRIAELEEENEELLEVIENVNSLTQDVVESDEDEDEVEDENEDKDRE